MDPWTVSTSAAVALGQWTHVAYTYDGAMVNLYANGELQVRTIWFLFGYTIKCRVDGYSFDLSYYGTGHQSFRGDSRSVAVILC